LLISNITDYVGLGSLRFFYTDEERGGRAGEVSGLACYHVIVQFVVRRHSFRSPSVTRTQSCRSPLRGLVRFLLFYTVSYFVLSEEENGDDNVDLSYFGFAITFNFSGFER